MKYGANRNEAVQRYDAMAPTYDCIHGLRWNRAVSFVEAIRKRAVANLKLQPGQTVIDVGCGDGASFGIT